MSFVAALLGAGSNVHVKCFDWRFGVNGGYSDLLGKFLQRKRVKADYHLRPTNKDRAKERECLWGRAHEELRETLRRFLVDSYEYYAFCNECIGSSNDLFSIQQPGPQSPTRMGLTMQNPSLGR